jgi:hypothetical protein
MAIHDGVITATVTATCDLLILKLTLIRNGVITRWVTTPAAQGPGAGRCPLLPAAARSKGRSHPPGLLYTTCVRLYTVR